MHVGACLISITRLNGDTQCSSQPTYLSLVILTKVVQFWNINQLYGNTRERWPHVPWFVLIYQSTGNARATFCTAIHLKERATEGYSVESQNILWHWGGTCYQHSQSSSKQLTKSLEYHCIKDGLLAIHTSGGKNIYLIYS